MEQLVQVPVQLRHLEGRYKCPHCGTLVDFMSTRAADLSKAFALSCRVCNQITWCQVNFGIMKEQGVIPG